MSDELTMSDPIPGMMHTNECTRVCAPWQKRCTCGAEEKLLQNDEPIMQFFEYEYLPPHLAIVSREFASVMKWIVENLPRNAERSVALRKLLEAKDAAVRARAAK